MISSAEIRENLEYRNGQLFWVKPGKARKFGIPLGCDNGKGYLVMTVNKQKFYLHRLVWMYFNGHTPYIVDHINGNPADNRIENLRPATKAQNCQNRQRPGKNNTSGFKGVTFNKRVGKFHAKIGSGKSRKHLGFFETPIEAAKAYDAAALELHGTFASPNFNN